VLASLALLLHALLLLLLEPAFAASLLLRPLLLHLLQVLLEFGHAPIPHNLPLLRTSSCRLSFAIVASRLNEKWIQLSHIFVFTEDFLISVSLFFLGAVLIVRKCLFQFLLLRLLLEMGSLEHFCDSFFSSLARFVIVVLREQRDVLLSLREVVYVCELVLEILELSLEFLARGVVLGGLQLAFGVLEHADHFALLCELDFLVLRLE